MPKSTTVLVGLDVLNEGRPTAPHQAADPEGGEGAALAPCLTLNPRQESLVR